MTKRGCRPSGWGAFLDSNELIINMGPQHPATHGVLRVILKLDGEKAPHRTGCEATGGRGSVESELLNRTTSRGEDVIRVGTDEPDCANYEH
jgi:hypothetical protein